MGAAWWKHCDMTLKADVSTAVLGIWSLREAVPSECVKGTRAMLTGPGKSCVAKRKMEGPRRGWQR